MSADKYVHLDTLRRVSRTPDRYKLFGRAAPDDGYLMRLSAAGILSTRQRGETKCRIDYDTGEIICNHTGQPGKDCRQRLCVYAALMRMRLIARLREAYALERNKLAAQS